jgi:hypothetical protein
MLEYLKETISSLWNFLCIHRNLVIPSPNKAIVLEDGLVDTVYPMLAVPTFPVVFKLLGTLRMVIDGQGE